ncbi:1024_t:CDS:2 [Entrophospora sp. SA101]|nr:1024_t:CDS:2 [Entrophospora sp. SA101]
MSTNDFALLLNKIHQMQKKQIEIEQLNKKLSTEEETIEQEIEEKLIDIPITMVFFEFL